MNDEQIDNMIRISLKREETLETIGRNVMTDIRRRSRRRRVMAIARLIAAAFGLPALAVAAVVRRASRSQPSCSASSRRPTGVSSCILRSETCNNSAPRLSYR